MTRLYIACLLLAAVPARADWLGRGEVGLVLASGNTEARTFNSKLGIVRSTDDWKNAFNAAMLYAADESGTTARRWETSAQSDYNISTRNFGFGAARYEDDEFSGFEFQTTVSSGLGRRFIDRTGTQLSGTAGLGYKVFGTRATFDAAGLPLAPAMRDEEAIFRGTTDFETSVSTSTKVLNKLVIESGADNTFVRNELALQVQITNVLALAVAYSVRHNTRPPATFRGTDTLTTINLVGEIK